MNNIPDSGIVHHDEISLVDIAAIFIRRRWVFYTVLLLAVLLGGLYTFSQDARYEFSSIVHVGEVGSGVFVEPPSVTVATLENRWWPEMAESYRKDQGEGLPFRTRFSGDNKSGLLVLSSLALSGDSQLVEQTHRGLLDKVVNRLGARLDDKRESLKNRIDAAEQVLERVSGEAGNGQVVADVLKRKNELLEQLSGLRAPEVLAVARKDPARVGSSPVLMMAIFAFIGVVFGVFAAFFAEFSCRVRARLREEEVAGKEQ